METRARETLDGLSVRTLQSVRTHVASPLRWSAADRGDRPRRAVELQASSSSTSRPPPWASPRPSRCCALVRRLADHGLGVVLISHNLNDVFQVADDIAVLYLGQMVAQVRRQGRHLQPGGRADHHRPLGDTATRREAGRQPTPSGREDAMSTTTDATAAPPATEPAPSTPTGRRPQATLGDIVRDYVTKVRGGDVGALPAVARPDRAGRSCSRSCGRIDVHQRVQLRQPDPPGRGRHRPRDGPGLRAAARRDRPVGRLSPAASPPRVMGVVMTNHGWPWVPALVAGLLTGAVIGLIDRPAGRAARHPVVRRHAGLLPGPAGRAAADHRRGRHDRLSATTRSSRS